MKKVVVAIVLLSIGLWAMPVKNYRAVPVQQATLLKSGKDKMYCTVCGMTLPMFYRTNHAAKHKHDNKHEQYCSIVCEMVDMIINGKELTDFKVVDNTTLKFIPAKDAYFVVGSKKPGTMSMVSKYGFGTLEAAKKFQKENGGKIMRFNELVKMVKENLKDEIAARKKRMAKMKKMGHMLYKKLCKPVNKNFKNIADAKIYLKQTKSCGNIKGKKLQAIGIYLLHR